ncbi:MAG: hypothetical protein GC150_13670 [Rhizobiales bacterium]|nr:hypothetical protein [Hyphomicrobiales bacterium]
MTFRILSVLLLAAAAFVLPPERAEAVEFLFTRDYYEHKTCREPVKAIRTWRRGTVGRRYDIVERAARYEWRTRRVMVRPPLRTVHHRHAYHGGKVVVYRPAVYETIRERVLVRPVKYRAVRHDGWRGWVPSHAIVRDERARRWHCR